MCVSLLVEIVVEGSQQFFLGDLPVLVQVDVADEVVDVVVVDRNVQVLVEQVLDLHE